MKKHIPNTITLLNLASGVIAIIFASQNQLEYAAYFIIAGILFDFLDGFVARLINAQSELGVQLDSLADMVTSGVAPGIIMFQLLRHADVDWSMTDYLTNISEINFLPFIGILVSLAAAYRLAKFNIDNGQHDSFIGLPTPAFTLFILSLPLISKYGTHSWVNTIVNSHLFLILVVVIGSILMNSKLALFSLKFKNFSLKDNFIKYFFLFLSAILLGMLNITAIPFIIVLYILLSVVNNLFGEKSESPIKTLSL